MCIRRVLWQRTKAIKSPRRVVKFTAESVCHETIPKDYSSTFIRRVYKYMTAGRGLLLYTTAAGESIISSARLSCTRIMTCRGHTSRLGNCSGVVVGNILYTFYWIFLLLILLLQCATHRAYYRQVYILSGAP